MPGLMDYLFLKWSIEFDTARYVIRTVVGFSQVGGSRQCYKRTFQSSEPAIHGNRNSALPGALLDLRRAPPHKKAYPNTQACKKDLS